MNSTSCDRTSSLIEQLPIVDRGPEELPALRIECRFPLSDEERADLLEVLWLPTLDGTAAEQADAPGDPDPDDTVASAGRRNSVEPQ
jgi:hypothetical protein